MATVSSSGLTAITTEASSLLITSLGRECTRGRTGEGTLGPGEKIKCTVTGSLSGPMGANTLASTAKIKSRASGHSHGRTGATIKGIGRTGSSTGRAPLAKMVACAPGNGRKARKCKSLA
eukprot:CAMPEP_0185590716 /NCGR_PEP_ID=MMETSP0434-20130131/61756_1 /TAXON_ID=626734 ORGANISM="Favella taraikaensis, Strain Fe Narragansett Bay" /NCGR_SAMPLE_ID=MMETSP0434 /ASSEMBLY_ACC=CAM_ASM_000379 /LENGTH=119 /DNA_ID=CAMNT_0028215103 /DNA_START=691 /DNA_END=1050 /DNA_ORIENTATION=-